MATMTSIRPESFSYRFAEQVLNSKLALKQEVEAILTTEAIEVASLSRPNFNKVLKESFVARGWQDQPHVFSDDEDLGAKMDFLKRRHSPNKRFQPTSQSTRVARLRRS